MPAGFIDIADYRQNQTGLNAALADCASQSKDLWGGFRSIPIGSTITLPVGISIVSRLMLAWTGGTSGPAMVIGASGQINYGVQIDIDVRGGPESWSGADDDVGVRIFNPQCCAFRIVNARGFTRGVQLIADGGLEAFGNLIECGQITNNRDQMVFDARGSSASAIRDNLLIGGRISVFSNMDSRSGHRIAWKLESSDATAAANLRNNLWLKASIESRRGTSMPPLDMGYLWSQGPENEMWGTRDESQLNTENGDGHLVADGPNAEYNIQHNGFYDFNRPPPGIVTINGAPSGRNAQIWRRQEAVAGGMENAGGLRI